MCSGASASSTGPLSRPFSGSEELSGMLSDDWLGQISPAWVLSPHPRSLPGPIILHQMVPARAQLAWEAEQWPLLGLEPTSPPGLLSLAPGQGFLDNQHHPGGHLQGRAIPVGFHPWFFTVSLTGSGGEGSPTNSWCLSYLICLLPHQSGDSLRARAAILGFREGLPPRCLTL